MVNKQFLSVVGTLAITVSFSACSHKTIVIQPEPEPQVQFLRLIAGENLSALTEVTKSDETCYCPFGGDQGRNLFFAVEDKTGTYSNIFHRPDNPISTAMSQRTGGKNHNLSPTYCAATNQLAFAGRQQGSDLRDIFLINLSQGNGLTQLTNTRSAEESYPCLSRDGQSLVYQRLENGRKNYETEIWLKKLRTGEDIMLGIGLQPSFSPDGRTIVFVRYTEDGQNTCLWTMTAEGANPMKLSDSSLGNAWHPRFSPNGQQIVFDCYKSHQDNTDLYVISCNGSAPIQLTINESYDGQPYWADDGNIYFTSDRGGHRKHYQIWRFMYEGAVPQTLTEEHIVRQGETISQIASRYGTTVSNLVKLNNLQTMTVSPGQRLKVK